MQPIIPGCRKRVWKKEWRQTVGSQTSLMARTGRIAERNERRRRREDGGEGNGGRDDGGGGWKKERVMILTSPLWHSMRALKRARLHASHYCKIKPEYLNLQHLNDDVSTLRKEEQNPVSPTWKRRKERVLTSLPGEVNPRGLRSVQRKDLCLS